MSYLRVAGVGPWGNHKMLPWLVSGVPGFWYTCSFGDRGVSINGWPKIHPNIF